MPRAKSYPKENLIGRRFEKLTVISQAEDPRFFVCACDCGRSKTSYFVHLKMGKVISCGCVKIKGPTISGRFAGGAKPTKTWHVWSSMRQRCQNPNHKFYHRYGGRGIKVCERWENYENFLADMGEKPEGLSIDRIDNDGDYEPTNCRWVNQKTQGNNTEKTITITYKGHTKTITEWMAITGLRRDTITRRVQRGLSSEKILTTPSRQSKRKEKISINLGEV